MLCDALVRPLPFGHRWMKCTNCANALTALDTLDLGKIRWCYTCDRKTEWVREPNDQALPQAGRKKTL